MKTIANNKGQVALIVLLVSAVVMTLGLSAAKRTVVDTKVETDQGQLKQAFNAAESGIEYFLGTGKTVFTSSDNVSRADISVKNIGAGTTVNFDEFTLPNNSLQYWLVAHNDDGTIKYSEYYGGDTLSLCIDSTFNGALKVDYFSRVGGAYKVKRSGYNVNSNGYVTGYTDKLGLSAGGCVSGYRELSLETGLTGTTPLFVNIKPMKNGSKFYLLGDGGSSNFPVQGVELSSTGRVGDVNTGVNRKLSVSRIYQVPGFALEAITSFGNVFSN